jgi:hypothetical protein
MNENITSYVLEKLSRAYPEDDIIYFVCQKTGLGWEKAQAFVEQVKCNHLADIETRQAPLISLMSFMFYVVGIVLTLGPIVYLWSMLDITSIFLVFISDLSNADAETALRLFESRCLLLGWFELPSIIFTMFVGLGIIYANIRYMRGIWEVLLRKWKAIT